MAGEFIEIARIGDDPDFLIEMENETVCFDRMDMPDRHRKGDILYRIRLTGLQHLDSVKVGSHVVEHHGIPEKRILRAEKRASLLEPPFRHRLYHNIYIIGMIQVFVREDDSIES